MMRFSVYALVRLIAFTALAASALALGVSRIVPRPKIERTPAQPRFVGLSGVAFSPARPNDYLLDTETGKLQKVPYSSKFSIDLSTSQPWRESGSQEQLVGRLIARNGSAGSQTCECTGLGVMDRATGELIQQIETDAVVSGRPCWLPGPVPRVIFPAGDGRLYLSELSDFGPTISPRHIVWRRSIVNDGAWLLGDPIFPSQPEFGGRLFATVIRTRKVGTKITYLTSELWSLKLSPDFSEIIDGQRITESESGESTFDERLPNFTVTPDGTPVLAYLKKVRNECAWKLIVSPLRFDKHTGDPLAIRAEEIEVASDHVVTLPGFSQDGGAIYSVARRLLPDDSVSKTALCDVLKRNSRGLELVGNSQSPLGFDRK